MPKIEALQYVSCVDTAKSKPKSVYQVFVPPFLVPETFGETVDGRNPAQSGMYKTSKIMG